MLYFENTVVFVRHGQTEWNAEKRTQGHLDSPLTNEGVFQVKELANNLKNYNFDLIVSSPLGRAKQTAEILQKELGISEMKISSAFTERNLGILQGKTKQENIRNFPQFYDEAKRFIMSSEIPSAEPIDEFLVRVSEGIEALKKLSKTKNILVSTHDGVLHAVASHIRQIPIDKVKNKYEFKPSWFLKI